MAASTLAGEITAVASAVTAVGALVTALVAGFIKKQTTQIHVLVNSTSTDQLRRIQALTDALVTAGLAVPVDQSILRPVVDTPTTPV